MEFSRLYKKLENDYGLFEDTPSDNSEIENTNSLKKDDISKQKFSLIFDVKKLEKAMDCQLAPLVAFVICFISL